MNNYLSYFRLEKKKCFVLKNAISPAFANIFNKKVYEERKNKPPILVYTSTPFRGLNILLDVFPEVRKQVPEVKLWIFSSMKVYQQDDKPFEYLYEKAKLMDGVSYLGSVSQTELAKKLSKVSIFAYPNIFPETSCIAVMEAMAAGLSIVTSNLGALPDTTAGFADLIDLGDSKQEYQKKFTKKILENLKEGFSAKKYEKLKKQADFANTFYNWDLRAKEWNNFLESLL
jgi:glycosyltransferase involved in cell wall biosynthesis